MEFIREKFFDAYRREFGGALSQTQVDGLNQLLDGFETYHGWWHSIAHVSNALAQIKHETNQSFQPVVEGYYLGDSSKPNYFQGNTRRVTNFQRKLRYYPHFGMGHIQLTWLENYEEQDQLIRRLFPEIVQDFERRTDKEFSLIDTPRQILDAKISFAAMTIGMCRGTFTTKKLADYDGKNFDHFNARAIVNGDKNYKNDSGIRIGDVIAGDARKFERILSSVLDDDDPPLPRKPNLVDDQTGSIILAGADETDAEPVKANEPEPLPATGNDNPVAVAQVVPEKQPATAAHGVKAYWGAALTFITVNAAAVWNFVTGSPVHIVVALFIAGAVVGTTFFVARYFIVNARERREFELTKEREHRAHELQLFTLKAAADKSLNTVQIVPQPIQNSD